MPSTKTMTRFPELQQSVPPEPISHEVLEGIVIITGYCGLMYLIPLVGMVFLIKDRLQYTQRLGAIGLVLCVLVPLLWALYNPIGGWFFLLPIVAPAAFASFLLFINANRRLYHRQNPTNLLQFRKAKTAIPNKITL